MTQLGLAPEPATAYLASESLGRLGRAGRAGACNTSAVIDELRAAAAALHDGNPAPLAALFADDAEWRGISHGHLWWKRTPA